MLSQFQLLPEKRSFAVSRKMCLIYGAFVLTAVALTGVLVSEAAGKFVLCLAVCGFVLMDLIAGLARSGQTRASRVRSILLCGATLAAIGACVLLFFHMA